MNIFIKFLIISLVLIGIGVSIIVFFPTYIGIHDDIQQKEDEFAGFVVVSDIPDRMCDIRDYGASEGGQDLTTDAINAAIDACADMGGGTVIVPDGTWLSGAIKLQSNINLFLADEAEIVFSTDLNNYLPVVLTRFQGIEFYNYSPLVYAQDCTNVAITGAGKLVGNGEARTDWDGGGDFGTARMHLYLMAKEGVPPEERIFGDNEPGLRPSFVQFVNCKDVLLDGITVENGPIWTIHPIYTENFTARNIHINTWSGNTDGIVLDSTKHALIEDSYIEAGDDAVVIKSGLDEDGWRVNKPTEDVKIRNIVVMRGNSGVSIGSEMSGGVTDIDIRDSVFKNTRHGFRIKSTGSRGGFIENIHVENIEVRDVRDDIIDINLTYSSALSGGTKNKPTMDNVLIKNMWGSGSQQMIINMDGMTSTEMNNIRIEDIVFDTAPESIKLEKVRNVTLKNVYVQADENPMIEIEDSQNITIDGAQCWDNMNPCFHVHGAKTDNILLRNVDFSGTLQEIVLMSDGAIRDRVQIVDDVE